MQGAQSSASLAGMTFHLSSHRASTGGGAVKLRNPGLGRDGQDAGCGPGPASFAPASSPCAAWALCLGGRWGEFRKQKVTAWGRGHRGQGPSHRQKHTCEFINTPLLGLCGQTHRC